MKLIVKMRSFDEKVSKCKQVTSSPELSRSARAIVMRNYRARLKEDPLKYQLYCQSESHRSWIHRRQLTNEQKRKYTNKSKLRMRRLRERRKAEKNENHKAGLVIETKSTQLKKENQRQHWRMQKHAHRAKMSSEEFKRDKYVSKNAKVPSSPKLSRSARAIVMRNYRAKLKEDPQKYQLHRQLESHRSRLHRRQLSEEQKRKYNEKSKLRMRRLRERRKAEENANHNLAELGIETKSTQLKEEEQRRCRRMKTQVPRAGTSSSEEKRLVRDKMLGSIADESSSSEQEGSDSEDARAARRKATSMVKTVIPKLSADHYAKVVASLINTASPEQLTALRKHLVTI
ncbi:uncharacterized protein [Apostichopus japonicus]